MQSDGALLCVGGLWAQPRADFYELIEIEHLGSSMGIPKYCTHFIFKLMYMYYIQGDLIN